MEDGWLVQRCAKLLHHFLLLNSNFAYGPFEGTERSAYGSEYRVHVLMA